MISLANIVCLEGAGGEFVALEVGPAAKRRWWKELIPADTTYWHPNPPGGKPQKLRWSEPELHDIAKESKAYAASQDFRVPVPEGHRFDASATRAFALDYKVEPGSKGKVWLKGLVEEADKDTADKIGSSIRDVSVYIEPEAKDSFGKTYRNCVTHIALTPYPVVHSGNFEPVALSRGGAEVPVFLTARPQEPEGATNMGKRMARLAKCLGVKHDEPDADDKALAALGLGDDGESDESYAKKLDRMKAAAKLDGLDFPQKQTHALEARANELEARATALANEKTALAGRVLALEFDGLASKCEYEAKGPIEKDTIDWARAEYSAGRSENAKRILGQAVALAKASPKAGEAGARFMEHPALAVSLESKKERVQIGAAMLSRGGLEVETREDGLAYRKKGDRDWIVC